MMNTRPAAGLARVAGGLLALALLVSACAPANTASEPTQSTGAVQPEATSALTTAEPAAGATTGVAAGQATAAATAPATAAATSAASGQATAAPAATQTGGQAGPRETAAATQTTEAEQILVQTSNLIGMDVMDAQGTLGQIRDVLVDQAGDVRFVVVELPAVGGSAAQRVMLDWDQIETTVEGANLEDVQLQFAGTQQELQNALKFTLDEANTDLILRSAETQLPAEVDNLIRLSQLQQLDLQPAGTGAIDVGQMQDLLVDLRQGRVDFGAVNLNQLLGTNVTVLVPWEQFNIDPAAVAEAQAFTLNVSPDTLRNAPPVDLTSLPTFIDPNRMDWAPLMDFWKDLTG